MKVTESERAFLHELNAIKKDPLGKRVIHFSVSMTPGEKPSIDKINKAIAFVKKAMDRAVYMESFVASNGDFFICYSHVSISHAMGVCSKIQHFFMGDAVLSTKNPYGEYSFYKIADASRDLDKIFTAFRSIISEAQPDLKNTFKNPILPEHVAYIRDKLKTQNIRACLFNQPVYLISNKTPSIEYLKFFVSLEKLEETYLPNTNLTAHPWNFLTLAEELDRAVLRVVGQEISEFRHKGFSINVALRTVLGKEFTDFMDHVPAKLGGRIIIEINKTDLLQHLTMLKDLDVFRKETGIKMCVSGLDFHDFEVINFTSVQPDFIRVDWRNSLLSLNDEAIERLFMSVRAHAPAAFVLSRCDNPKAFPFARALGIQLVSGRLADKLFRSGMEM